MVCLLSAFGQVDRLRLGAHWSALLCASADADVDAYACMYIDELMGKKKVAAEKYLRSHCTTCQFLSCIS